MKKYILATLISGMMVSLPIAAAETPTEGDLNASVAVELHDVVVSMNGSNLRVQNASGQTLEIYNVTGVRVFAAKIETNDKSWNLNLGRGCYIVKVGKTVRKISIL